MGPARPQRSAIKGHLREQIDRLAAAGASRLPAERSLARSLGVSRGTLRALLVEFAGEGLLLAEARAGWRIVGRDIFEPTQVLRGFNDTGRLYGHRPHSRVLASRVREASPDEAARMHLPTGATVWSLTRLRFLDDRPTCVEALAVSTVGLGDLPALDMTDRSLYEEFSRRGIEVERTEVMLEAESAERDVAGLLDVAPGSALLKQNELALDPYGREIFLGISRFRGDSYRFRSTVTRRLRR